MNNIFHKLSLVLLTDYTELGGDEELPLGAEFQEHIQCFVDPHAKTAEEQYRQAGKLIKQLAYVLPVFSS